jgi:hypothetical protein
MGGAVGEDSVTEERGHHDQPILFFREQNFHRTESGPHDSDPNHDSKDHGPDGS